MDEDDLLAWLRTIDPQATSAIGDDAALLEPAPEQALTVDSQIEGVHFLPGLDPAVVAERLLAVNLSDLAAVGARPELALLALSAPLDFQRRRFFRALLDAMRRHGVRLAGGDLARAPLVVASLTLLGHLPSGGRWLRRDGARPGDALWVGGTLGESALGRHLLARVGRPDPLAAERELRSELIPAARRAIRRHLRPEPQLELGRWLSARRRVAALDLSDGLARDLPRLCRASGVGAAVEANALPVAAGSDALCIELGLDRLEMQLGGGEDYVLLFTLPTGESPPERFGCRRIGQIHEGRSLRLQDPAGERSLPAIGWDHLSDRAG